MADKPINLRLRRKQKAREDKRKQSKHTTAANGVRKADRQQAAKVSELHARSLEAHRLDRSQDTAGTDDT